MSRWLRDSDVYVHAKKLAREAALIGNHKLNNALSPDPPVMPTLEHASIEQAIYGTKYNSKVDNVDISAIIVSALSALSPFVNRFSTNAAAPGPELSAEQQAGAQGRRNIARLENKNATCYSATAGVMLLLGHGDHVKSHETAVFHAYHFKKQ